MEMKWYFANARILKEFDGFMIVQLNQKEKIMFKC